VQIIYCLICNSVAFNHTVTQIRLTQVNNASSFSFIKIIYKKRNPRHTYKQPDRRLNTHLPSNYNFFAAYYFLCLVMHPPLPHGEISIKTTPKHILISTTVNWALHRIHILRCPIHKFIYTYTNVSNCFILLLYFVYQHRKYVLKQGS